ncbi:MAG: O-antigen ligase family protein, partial [Pyrinomonadaceae bacterium]|nr:O-antigen ligase family protein [Pyrinomonadaceae bacterium]
IHGVAPDGPLARSGLGEGDTLLKADGRKLSNAEQLIDIIEANGSAKVAFHRSDWYSTTVIYEKDLLVASDANSRLGVGASGPSHYWRMMGFYNHYTTYAEVLQLIMSLLFGLMAAAILKRQERSGLPFDGSRSVFSRAASIMTSTPFLIASFAAMCVAMIMTVTRASQLSFMIAAGITGMIMMSRRALIVTILVAIPVGLAGLYLLKESRQVGFFDQKDESSQYRMMMWRDGIKIWQASPRHVVFGVGMDSIQKHWQEWEMFDKGWQHMGHFHSTPVQLLVERGLPALILWLMVLAIYARSLWKGISANKDGDWRTVGILTGCLGGAIGFFSSGVVHWNLGDSEVAMVFFLLMGIGVRTVELSTVGQRISPKWSLRGNLDES